MRRSDKELTNKAEIDAIIRECQVCRLGLCLDGIPYIVPMNFGYDGEHLYFHCAGEGRKLDIIRANNKVCVEFDISDGLVRGGSDGCEWGMNYRSVIAFGTAQIIDDLDERRHAFTELMAQYAEGIFRFPDAMLRRTTAIRVTITSISGKQSK